MVRRRRRDPERQVQDAILEAAQMLGLVLVPTDAGAIARATEGAVRIAALPKGWPDLSGVLHRGPFRGRAVFVEVKQPGRRPEPEQDEWLDRLAEAGAAVNWFTDAGEALRWLVGLLDGVEG